MVGLESVERLSEAPESQRDLAGRDENSMCVLFPCLNLASDLGLIKIS